MKKTVLKALIDIGRNRDWLAERLGIKRRTLERRLADENQWTLQELRTMKKLFKWETLEG